MTQPDVTVVVGGGAKAPSPAVAIKSITKSYGALRACDDVSMVLEAGRIHGILGQNGAGKSTLMKILIGLVLPDAGSIHIDGEPCRILDPLDAAARGIGMVHQHFSLVDQLSVWENVALGEAGRLDPGAVRRRVGEISEHYGLHIDPDARVGDLTAGLRQRVEIIKCLRRDPSIVVFDEPTSVLTPDESQQLFTSLRRVVLEEHRAVVLVSHKLDEILHATDEVTIMRQGSVVERMETADADAPGLARAMVGRSVSLRSERAALGLVVAHDAEVEAEAAAVEAQVASTAPVLRLDTVTVIGAGGVRLLDGLTVEVHPGEIVGVAGVEGNGQRVLADVLSSLVPVNSGTVTVDGATVSTRHPGSLADAGVAVIPEDRHDSGVVLDMSVAENLVLIDPFRLARRGVFDRPAMIEHAERMIAEFDIQCAGPDAPLWTLSGGNQQRVVLARELALGPRVLVAAQPTRGLDVGAIEYMADRIRAVAASGVGVLLISSELEEILELSHRIVVMHRGRIVGEMPRAEAELEQIGLLMGGVPA